MIPRLVNANYVKGYILHLRFEDGVEGQVDFEKELNGEIFEPLKNNSYFKKFCLDQELHTIVWPNGADFAPEFLYNKVLILSENMSTANSE